MLINSKSIIDCDEYEEEEHNNEIESFMEKIYMIPNYKCAVIRKDVDMAHMNNKEKIYSCYLHEFLEIIEYCDIKYGVDVVFENNKLKVITYGQNYIFRDNYYMRKSILYIIPYDKNKNEIDILQELKIIDN